MKAVNTDVSLEQHRLRNLHGGIQDGDAVNLKQGEQSKSVVILSPQATDELTLFYTRYAVTVQQAMAVLRSGGVSHDVVVTVHHGTDRSSSAGTVVNGQTASSVTSGDSLTLNDVTIPANSWVWLVLGTVTGDVQEFHLSVFFRVDP